MPGSGNGLLALAVVGAGGVVALGALDDDAPVAAAAPVAEAEAVVEA